MLTGSCLCGGVAYEAAAEPSPIVHCHCRTCRKTHGAAFSSVATVPKSSFRWTKGMDLLREFESSPGKIRKFCQSCGSHLVAERAGKDVMVLRLGCLDTPIEPRVMAHIWRSDGAPWYDPGTAVPELLEGLDKPALVRE
jgi:hypothetical protein